MTPTSTPTPGRRHADQAAAGAAVRAGAQDRASPNVKGLAS
jgi:hypothetical protein